MPEVLLSGVWLRCSLDMNCDTKYNLLCGRPNVEPGWFIFGVVLNEANLKKKSNIERASGKKNATRNRNVLV
jgi:hypothetical protein